MQTLAEFLPLFRTLGDREALRFHNGYRTWRASYRDLEARIGAVVACLDSNGISKGERVLLWGENRLEWTAVFWACVARGVQVVPIDFHSSARFLARVQQQVRGRLLIFGEEVDATELQVDKLSFRTIADLPVAVERFEPSAISRDDVVEIVFTSGTTGEPKGVVHRHKNICANLTPIHEEINRLRWLARPFQPIRFLNLLPLSHMFGQTAGLYIPPLLGGAVVFTQLLNPGAVLETIHRERISVLVSVPKLLCNLRNEIGRRFEIGAEARSFQGLPGAAESWWKHRRVHGALGWKFWAVVVGGAQLDSELEGFWRRLGFVLIQGYGLTEASPVVAMNHPLSTRRGSIGQAIEGQQIRVATDGEILVRGDSVVTEYLEDGRLTDAGLDDGWLHTGDAGEIDEQGRLYYKGRLKEMIVTADGLNVYPSDIEAVLNRLPRVKESVVVPVCENGEEKVHAVLILRVPSARPETLIGAANRELEAHQRINSWSLWPEDDFPRTDSTFKLKRGEIAARIGLRFSGRASPRTAPAKTGVPGALAQFAARKDHALGDEARLAEDLGVSSLERVELMSQLENECGVEFDEARFSAIETVGELQAVVRDARQPESGLDVEAVEGSVDPLSRGAVDPPESHPAVTAVEEAVLAQGAGSETFALPSKRSKAARMPRLPRWNRSALVRGMRCIALEGLALPMFRQMLVRFSSEGIENLADVKPPVIFAANHNSHLDTIAILAALPPRLRRRVAPAMSQDYFLSYWDWRQTSFEETLKIAGQYYLTTFLVNAYPLPQKMSGTRRALRYTGELVDEGFCPLVFPEGGRSPDGGMQPFKSGIGLMAVRLGVPVVPIRLEGLFEIYSLHHEWPKPGSVRVRFGKPLSFSGQADYERVAQAMERAVLRLAER